MRQDQVASDFKRLLPLVEPYLTSSFVSGNAPILVSAINYSLKAGGKRIRPVLCLLTAESVGGHVEDAISCAMALEYIHTYSLIHDDLPAMDDDDVRRGKPTCHVVFGEGQAILAGDGLLTEAFGCIASDKKLSCEQIVDVIKVLSNAAGWHGMVGGQSLDLEASLYQHSQDTISMAKLQQIHKLKTGALIGAAMEIGAIAGGAPLEMRNMIKTIGEAIGLAFQIKDDILDVTSNDLVMGKRVGKDEKKNKTTYPRLLGLVNSEHALEVTTKQALDLLINLPNPISLIALTEFLAERAV